MDKQTESLARQEFETWAGKNAAWLDLTPAPDDGYLDESTGELFDVWIFAWQSSRESLVVELPNEQPHTDGLLADGWMLAEQSLSTSSGLSASESKGKGYES